MSIPIQMDISWSIICINRADDAFQIQELELVDGQQRLTTLSLLYAAIYAQFAKFNDLDEETKHELYNLKYRLLVKGATKSCGLNPPIRTGITRIIRPCWKKLGFLKMWSNRQISGTAGL